MEEKRAKTLEALSAFIHSQKALLGQTQKDITRLRELRDSVVAHPENALDTFLEQVSTIGHLSTAQLDITASVAQELDWDILQSCDPMPFKNFTSTLRRARAERTAPSHKQTSELSDLQRLVKDARVSMVDPILASYAVLNDPDTEPEDLPDPEEIRRALEREKIRELKQRRIRSDVAVPVFAGLRRPVQASCGVFIRRDQEDESAEVDISLDCDDDVGEKVPSVFDHSEAVLTEADTPATSVASPVSMKATLPSLVDKPTRTRRPTQKAQEHAVSVASSSGTRLKGRGKQQVKRIEPEPELPDTQAPVDEDDAPPDTLKESKKGKAKSETYKQAWSVSEQHLLERLLEEIPDGTKNRWAKISQAMGGRRTARQVASRVQKYFEKLKRFGVELGGGVKNAA